jgi:hypothetical protein
MDVDPLVRPSGFGGFVFAVLDLAIGAVAAGLALNDDFAAGKAAFAAEAWRTTLAVAGIALSVFAIVGLVRVAGGQPRPLSRGLQRRARLVGRALIVIGAWLFACATVDAVARETVSFDSWTSPFFTGGGLYLVALGLSLQLNVTRGLRKQQLASGAGVPGTATIVGVSEAAASTDEGTLVRLDLRIDVNGRVYEATELTTTDPSSAALFKPGATLDVLVDYVDPQVFRLDWKTWTAPEP